MHLSILQRIGTALILFVVFSTVLGMLIRSKADDSVRFSAAIVSILLAAGVALVLP